MFFRCTFLIGLLLIWGAIWGAFLAEICSFFGKFRCRMPKTWFYKKCAPVEAKHHFLMIWRLQKWLNCTKNAKDFLARIVHWIFIEKNEVLDQIWDHFSCTLAPQRRFGSLFKIIFAHLYSVRSPKGLLEASGLDFGSIWGGLLEGSGMGFGVDFGRFWRHLGWAWYMCFDQCQLNFNNGYLSFVRIINGDFLRLLASPCDEKCLQ